ncbi:MAG: hypothetical protein V4481_04315 [Patescibacteria group bacterium]
MNANVPFSEMAAISALLVRASGEKIPRESESEIRDLLVQGYKICAIISSGLGEDVLDISRFTDYRTLRTQAKVTGAYFSIDSFWVLLNQS